jgi:hypothetical protein
MHRMVLRTAVCYGAGAEMCMRAAPAVCALLRFSVLHLAVWKKMNSCFCSPQLCAILLC